MPLTEAQRARQRLGGLIRLSGDPDLIEAARSQLAFANASAAIASWTTLTLPQRIELARQLTGHDQDAA